MCYVWPLLLKSFHILQLCTSKAINPSTSFLNFWHLPVRKFVETTGKSTFISVNLPSFKSDVLGVWRYSSEKFRKYTEVCMLCGKFVPPTIAKTYVFKISRDFEMLYLRYFSTNHFQTSQHLLNLRAVFPASRRIYFPWRVHEQSLKKKVGNVCYTPSYCREALVFFFSIWTQTWVPVSSHSHLDRFDLHWWEPALN